MNWQERSKPEKEGVNMERISDQPTRVNGGVKGNQLVA
jgi:hypothetical protein